MKLSKSVKTSPLAVTVFFRLEVKSKSTNCTLHESTLSVRSCVPTSIPLIYLHVRNFENRHILCFVVQWSFACGSIWIDRSIKRNTDVENVLAFKIPLLYTVVKLEILGTVHKRKPLLPMLPAYLNH